jgi:hypothetical protein
MEQSFASIDEVIANAEPVLPYSKPEERAPILEALHKGVVKVSFNKVDGTPRVMAATLDPKLLPAVEIKESTPSDKPAKPRKENTTSVRVYDVEINEWRSITWANITNIQY